jgi:16S rRNA (cytidine1402-2'-O)-methyltransferase
LSPRARETLALADFIACEDTRVTGKLLSLIGIEKPLVRLDEHASESKLQAVETRIRTGEVCALVSDAGTPLLSDPGAAIVDRLLEAGIGVDSVPGPSASVMALALSGFYAQRFAFLGFLPRRPGPLTAEFAAFADSTSPIVFFESPARLTRTLTAAAGALGGRRAAICREMTKLHQEVVRGRLEDLARIVRPWRGEITVVIEGKRRRNPA